MLRRIEARIGHAGLLIGVFLLGALIASIAVGILGSSNIFWGEPDQYGKVRVPGSATLHLPSGDVGANAAIYIPGKTPGVQVDVPIPKSLGLAVTPAGGGAALDVSRDLGSSGNTGSGSTNAIRKVFTVHVPSDGDYRVRATGSFAGVGINAQLWFGHGPPIPGTLVPVIGAAISLLGMLIWAFVLRRPIGSRPEDLGDPGDPEPRHVAYSGEE